MTREIRIYVEGGGDGKDTKARLRSGFNKFLSVPHNAARARRIRWQVIAAGGREAVLDNFKTACRTHPDAFNILLVDSEGPVSAEPKQHLRERDGWEIAVPEQQCHLMVQAMEAWVVADTKALAGYYGQGFRETAIPKNQNVEEIDKDSLKGILRDAARSTKKGGYHEIRDGARILELLDPEVVCEKAKHCARLFHILAETIDAE